MNRNRGMCNQRHCSWAYGRIYNIHVYTVCIQCTYIHINIYIYTLRTPGSPSLQMHPFCFRGGGVGGGLRGVGWGEGVITSCRARFCGYKYDVIIAMFSGRKCYVFAMFSGWKCYVIAMFLGWKCYVIAMFSRRKCYVIAMFSGWKCYVIVMFSGWKCYVIAMFSGWKCYVFAMFSGWTCYVIAMFSGWKCYVIAMFSGWK